MQHNFMMKDNRKAENSELRKLLVCGSLMSQMITQNVDYPLQDLAKNWQFQLERVRKAGILGELK